jgi:hypothetical protein
MGRKWDSHNRYEARTDKGKRTQDALLTLELEPWEAGFIAFTVDWASEVLRVLKPGTSALVWALPRTSDLTVLGLRLAGFEIRDNFYHIFGQGFPKSADISKMIDRKNGKKREDATIGGHIGISTYGGDGPNGNEHGLPHVIDKGKLARGTPATPDAKLWDGWGTGLKPAAEEWVWAMKPVDGGFVNNALKWGVSGLWIDGGRVATGESEPNACKNKAAIKTDSRGYNGGWQQVERSWNGASGRWPANVILSHTEGCRRVGEKRVKGHSGGEFAKRATTENWRFDNHHRTGYTDPDGTETIDDWECVDGWQVTPPPDTCIYCGQSDPVEQECKDLAIDYVGIILDNINFIPFECQHCGEPQRWEFVRVQCPARQLGEQSGELGISKGGYRGKGNHGKDGWGMMDDPTKTPTGFNDTGTAARYFYQAKSSPRERHYGCDALYWRIDKGMPVGFVRISQEEWEQLPDEEQAKGNIHPTLKPLELIKYLVRLTRTPTGGVVLDPFAGSGTTGLACIDEGRDYILIEREREYCDIAEAKLAEKLKEAKQYDLPHLPR